MSTFRNMFILNDTRDTIHVNFINEVRTQVVIVGNFKFVFGKIFWLQYRLH